MPTGTVKTIPEGGFSRSRDDDRALAELARQQHGVVRRWQLINRGWSEGAIEKRIRSGRLHRLHAGVYAVGHQVIPKQGHWMAAVLASGPNAALSHQTAAALWELRGYSGGAIHVTLPRKSTSSKRIKRYHASLPPDEVAREQGVPVTSVHRTIFDLAATEDMDAIVAMIREAEYRNRYDRISLPHLLERYPGKRGARKVRGALERLKSEPPGRRRRGLEERFAPFLRRYRLPLPYFNDWIFLGGKRYCVDCHWRGTGQIVELDGWQGHSTRSAFRSDRERDRKLRVAGYSVIHLTWAQLDHEPEAVAADLRALLETNGALRAGPRHPPPGK